MFFLGVDDAYECPILIQTTQEEGQIKSKNKKQTKNYGNFNSAKPNWREKLRQSENMFKGCESFPSPLLWE